mmetsp:Transcript_4278/g.8178  ORF Transcript_4278/g.8178 Transcript_4278/m.8178 type:complete len:212 (+) Transcript_4278:892-1527(+)
MKAVAVETRGTESPFSWRRRLRRSEPRNVAFNGEARAVKNRIFRIRRCNKLGLGICLLSCRQPVTYISAISQVRFRACRFIEPSWFGAVDIYRTSKRDASSARLKHPHILSDYATAVDVNRVIVEGSFEDTPTGDTGTGSRARSAGSIRHANNRSFFGLVEIPEWPAGRAPVSPPEPPISTIKLILAIEVQRNYSNWLKVGKRKLPHRIGG